MAAAAPTPLQGILNLPRLEQLFGQLMARLAHQETEIAALQSAARHNATLEARCGGLEAQLARLEAATSLDAESLNDAASATSAAPSTKAASEAPGAAPSSAAPPMHHVPLNRQVAENSAAVSRLADLIDGRHQDHGKRHDDAARTHASLTERIDALELHGAAKDHALALEDELRAFQRRLDATDAVVATKVDGVDEAAFRATCIRLRDVDAFVAHSTAQIDALDERAATAAAERSHTKDVLEAAATVQAALQREVSAIVAVVGEDAVKREERDQALDAALAATTPRDAHAEHVAHHASTIEQLQQLKHDVERGFARQADELEANQLLVASQSAQDRDLARRGAEAASALARRLVDSAVRDLLAAPHGAVAECRGRVAQLEEKSTKSRAELDVALKFVDWFSKRGEGYEHNMTALDRRLDGMVNTARQASAAPFAASVRMPA